MKSFSTSIVIQANAQKIWGLLTDAPNYPTWNTTVNKVDGRIALGEKVTVHAKVSPGRSFPVKVVEFESPRHMIWASGMPLGLFKGERTYKLTPKPDGSVEFSMREAYTGLFAPMITSSIPDLQPAFDEFAAALKRRAEQ